MQYLLDIVALLRRVVKKDSINQCTYGIIVHFVLFNDRLENLIGNYYGAHEKDLYREKQQEELYSIFVRLRIGV